VSAILLSLAAVLGLGVVFLVGDSLTGRGVGRYVSRSGRTDALYTFVYVGGLFTFLVSGPVLRLVEHALNRYAPFLRLTVLQGLHPVVEFAVFTVLLDGVHYWVHRWLHASPTLWAFHSVHHAPASLTVLTNFRFHAVDVLFRTAALYLPGLVLGIRAAPWAAAGLLLLWLEMLAHSDRDWEYGPAGRVLVSPGFHRVHHSAEPIASNRNFGFLFSFWDRLFRTGAPLLRPAAYGAPGMGVPESFLGQLVFPFIVICRRLTGRPAVGGRRVAGA
jgi:sterol desaturase/sphingolipid hydroxylase (fatty acid hydroxylase superfamily)